MKKGQTYTDPYTPSVYGVGYKGVGKYSQTYDRKLYSTWSHMLSRCYSPKQQQKQPTYIGCTVCPQWHNLQVFGAWYEANYKEGLCLDKDLINREAKLYSPTTCQFITYASNTEEAHAKSYILKSPLGKKVEVYNLRKFCREHNLTQPNMSKVVNRQRKQHKGWELFPL